MKVCLEEICPLATLEESTATCLGKLFCSVGYCHNLSEINVFVVGLDAVLHRGIDTVFHGCIHTFNFLVMVGFFLSLLGH